MSASTTIITDLTSAITTGPSATSLTNAVTAANKMQDLKGNYDLLLTKAKELKFLIGEVIAVLDAGDGTKTTLQNVQSSLS